MVGETRDSEHAAEMVRALKERYTKLTFTGHGGALGLEIGEESEEESDEEDSGYGNSLFVQGEEGGRRRSISRRRLSIQTTRMN